MAIDTSIYQTLRPVETLDPMGSAVKAMSLSHLALQNRQQQNAIQEQQALKGIYADNENVGPNGRLSSKGLSALARLNPSKAIELEGAQNKLDSEALANQAKTMEQKINAFGTVAQLAAGAKNQADWDLTLKTAQKQGLDTSMFSPQFDPVHAAQIARIGFTAADRQKGMHDQITDLIAQQKAPLERDKTLAETRHLDAETGKIAQEMGKRNPNVLAQSDDPAKLVPGMVPKEHQAKAFGEIDAAENTKRMASEIMKSFDSATQENTALKTGFGILRTPASVMALHQALQPTFKDLEGTVRQAAMDNTFKNVTPAPGDTEQTIATKRAALKEYLQSKASAPVARAYGIDLAQYDSTAPYKDPEKKTSGTDAGLVKSANASDKPQGNYRAVGAKVTADEVSKYATKHGMKRSDAESFLKGQGYAIGN